MPERARLLNSIASITADYQAGRLAAPTAAHVDRWVRQFPDQVQQPILAEMEHVLGKTYYSKVQSKRYLRRVINHQTWTGGNPTAFWRSVNFLDIQPRGNSQTEFLSLFDRQLSKSLDLSIAECGRGNRFLYLDDGLFSGGRIRADLEGWIANAAPDRAELYIAVIALHAQGHYFTERALNAAIKASGKTIAVNWGHVVRIEDGLFATDTSDVLRPTGPGNDQAVTAYIQTLGKDPTWRTPGNVGGQGFFSSDAGRQLLENEFLKAGVSIRGMCPFLNDYQRPLGNTTMRTIGFGTLFATYRNCPNNAPLVLWAGDPWYPLLPRITN